MTRALAISTLALLLAACGGDEGGKKQDPGEGGSGGGNTACRASQCPGGGDPRNGVEAICLPGGCISPFEQDEFGDILRAEQILVWTLIDFSDGIAVNYIKSGKTVAYYPIDSEGRPVDCERILALKGAADPTLNVVATGSVPVDSGGLRDAIDIPVPLYEVAVPAEGKALVVYSRFHNDTLETYSREPQGDRMAEGCEEAMPVVGGPWGGHTDADHTFYVDGKQPRR